MNFQYMQGAVGPMAPQQNLQVLTQQPAQMQARMAPMVGRGLPIAPQRAFIYPQVPSTAVQVA